MLKLDVAAGTLMDQQGNPFSGTLSITEVPPDLTPAALPFDVFPDIVVTVQPGEMVFTEQAPLTFPNRGGIPPGELLSVNHITGLFDVVGEMQVSADGTVIETISGGIRNSSWRMPREVASPSKFPALPPGSSACKAARISV